MISAREALEIIFSTVQVVGGEEIELSNAHSRVLATDIQSPTDIPPFDNSSMDGYAVRVSDLAENSNEEVSLELVGEIAAGDVFGKELVVGSTVRTLTGAPIPKGADAVVEQELVTKSNGMIRLPRSIAAGRNVRRRGEDVRKGEGVMERGTILRAAHVGVLASLGITKVPVYRRPRVGILTTGNELVDVSEELHAGKIRNSNAYTLQGLIKESGCEPYSLGMAPDVEEPLLKKVNEGFLNDVLVTSGGVSVGEYDLVLAVLKKLGAHIHFWKVNIKPGMPLAFGMYEEVGSSRRVPVFALPGNPVSTMVTFLEFVRPGLRKMAGEKNFSEQLMLKATLEHEITKNDKKKHFSRGILRNEKGTLFVRTTGSQSSGVLTSLVKANCLIHIPEEKSFLRAGEEVEIELL